MNMQSKIKQTFPILLQKNHSLLDVALNKIKQMEVQHAQTLNALETDWKTKFERVLKDCCTAEANVSFLEARLDEAHAKFLDIMENYDKTGTAHLTLSLSYETLKGVHSKCEFETKKIRDEMIAIKYDLVNVSDNYAYARNHIKEQNTLLEKTKGVFDNLRTENETLKGKIVNQEHLAKKLVELQQGKQGLETTIANLWAENKRLFCNHFLSTDGKPCGTCYGCKLSESEKMLNRSVENVANLEAKLTQTQTILDKTIINLTQVRDDRENLRVKLTADLQLQHDRHYVTVNEMFREIDFLKLIIRTQETALETVAEGAIFGHTGIAQSALDRVKKLRADRQEVKQVAQSKSEVFIKS